MKVWITRPYCPEVHAGGFRSVRLWTQKPIYDHRLIKPYGSLHDRETGEFVSEIWLENGWYSESGCVRAKPFLKQDEAVKSAVWKLISQSVIPSTQPSDYRMSDQEYDALLNPEYELVCACHWKRFLLEIDLVSNQVYQVEAESLIADNGSRGLYEIPEVALLTNHFFDEDMNKPCDLATIVGSPYTVRFDEML